MGTQAPSSVAPTTSPSTAVPSRPHTSHSPTLRVSIDASDSTTTPASASDGIASIDSAEIKLTTASPLSDSEEAQAPQSDGSALSKYPVIAVLGICILVLLVMLVILIGIKRSQ